MTSTIMRGIPQVFDIVCTYLSLIIITPTDFDMNVLQERLKEQKRMREKAAKNKTPPSQRKEQYTPVELDTGSDELKMVDSATDSESSGDGAFRHKMENERSPTSAKPHVSHSSSTSESETTPKRKPLPPPPAKKSAEPIRSKRTPIQAKEDTSEAPTPSQALVDRMNQPLPPTPNEEPQSLPSRGRFKPPISSTGVPEDTSMPQAPQATGSALINEMIAKRGKSRVDGTGGNTAKKKQPIPLPKQRPMGKKIAPDPTTSSRSKNVPPSSSLTAEQLHEPAGYANLPVHDTPYQNVGFGPDSNASPQEPDTLYENIHKSRQNVTPKCGRVDPERARAQKGTGYVNVKVNGSGAGSEYQNVNSSQRPRPQRK